MAKSKILVTGATGQLGMEFCGFNSDRFEIIGAVRKDADIRDFKQVIKVVKKHEPEIIIHTAAMTDVDACEKEQDLAMAINCSGARNVALAAKKSNSAIIYISTDYVFDGLKNSAYVESDKTNPISHYGHSKLMGEKAVMEFHGNWTIVRCGWIYSQNGKNFVKSIITAAKKGKKPLKVVNDQIGSPTWTKDIVAQTLKILESGQTGLFHVASHGEISRFEFAKLFLQRLYPGAKIEPCTTKEYPLPAKRPARSSLSGERLKSLGIDLMRPLEVSLAEFIDKYGEHLLNEVPH